MLNDNENTTLNPNDHSHVKNKNCPEEYPESYIVNESKKRFKSELANSHFLSHWCDLCQHPEVTGTLRFIYNLINIKRSELVNLLYRISNHINKKESILDTHNLSDHIYSNKILQFLGLNNSNISRIKLTDQSPKKYNKISQHTVFNNLNSTSLSQKKEVSRFDRKILINLSLIINLQNEYPRNLLACPLDKVVLGEKYKNKNKTYNFICHTDNMIDRIKTDKLCLSLWLIKNRKKNGWGVSIKMGTAYLSDTFPGEKGTVNDYIKEILSIDNNSDAAKFLDKINEGIKNNYFYAIETSDPRIKDINKNKNKNNRSTKKTHKK